MENTSKYRFSEPVTTFHGSRLPERATPVGYAALIDALGLKVPMPRTLSAIGPRHKSYQQDGWQIYTPRHAPPASLEGHLTFALKYEGLDLLVLKALFQATGPEPIEAMARGTPTGTYARRSWFLYEWLLGKTLDLPAAEKGTYVQVVDPDLQWTAAAVTSTRHRVKNNLPGTPSFCPMIFRTEILREFTKRNLPARAREVVADLPADVLARTAVFLLLKDSRSSFEIEGEYPRQERIQRWARAIGEAGRKPIDLDELLRLQRIVIGDDRFVLLGLRNEGGFAGDRDRDSGTPLPVHISARHEDLPSLIEGLVAFDRKAAPDLDAVLAATVPAFGFIYIHPFADANGRLHRYLIIIFWRNAALIRRAWSFQSPPLSWIALTITGALLKAIRPACCPSSNGSRQTKGMFGSSMRRPISIAFSTPRLTPNSSMNAWQGRSMSICRQKPDICKVTTPSGVA